MKPDTAHCGIALVLVALAGVAAAQQTGEWAIHDEKRTQPRVVTPGAEPGQPPSDAVVLFDGKDLSLWRSQKTHGAAEWTVENGYVQVKPGTGGIETAGAFGDCQLHVEWMAPSPAVGVSQDRGNSGVFLMGQYEVQVLDSYESKTYADGQAAALYGQYPPLVNASRAPGLWQTYDIVFRGPRFDSGGTVTRPARVTVFHNGVLVQDARELTGPTAHHARPAYKAHAPSLPIGLQDHSHPVRFRNIWVRGLADQ
jgi:hypothetical protein